MPNSRPPLVAVSAGWQQLVAVVNVPGTDDYRFRRPRAYPSVPGTFESVLLSVYTIPKLHLITLFLPSIHRPTKEPLLCQPNSKPV